MFYLTSDKCFQILSSFVLEKYWKKYQYAAKFVQLVRTKTPKVTFYTRYAKCMLMENSPPADVEICFYDGMYSFLQLCQVMFKTLKYC